MLGFGAKTKMIDPSRALAGREAQMPVANRHAVLGTPLKPPFPDGVQQAVLGLGCFWGAERIFWQAPGVYTTAVGYAGGYTPNPTLRGGLQRQHRPHRGRARGLRSGEDLYEEILRLFWENHDPTQGMRQGNDVGTQYRSAIYCRPPRSSVRSPRPPARLRRAAERRRLPARSPTEIATAGEFYYAEDYHQQYLEKNPWRLLRHRRHRRQLPGRVTGDSGRSGLSPSLRGAAAHRGCAQ